MSSEETKIATLEQIAEVLEMQGYNLNKVDDSIHVKVGGNEHPFVSVITKNEADTELHITCKLTMLGDVPEEKIPQFFAACLDANTRILPYAIGLITGTDNPEMDDEKEWPVVLVDSIPLGDLCEEELISSMDSLWVALSASRDVLVNALN